MRCSPLIPLRPSIALLALVLALTVPASAPAAFPGVAGPIVFPKVRSDGVVEDRGGLFLHGPRKRQKSTRLTTDPDDGTPSFSADGRLVAFSSNRDPGSAPGSHIYLVKVNGGGLTQLTTGPVFDSSPSFAPNGQRLIFARRSGDKSHIYSVKVDGTGLRQLTKGKGNDSDPVYTPNGRRIVFVSDRDRDMRSDHTDIFAMAPNGTDIRVLIDSPYDEKEPDTAPNGRKIAFVSSRAGGLNVFVARSNGTRVQQLTRNRGGCFSGACNRSPVWAPDGKHIAFLSIGRYNSDLMVMRSDGRGEKEFADGGTETEGFGVRIGPPGWGIVSP